MPTPDLPIISSKKVLNPILAKALNLWSQPDKAAFWQYLDQEILERKIKFPLLEYVAQEWYPKIPVEQVLPITLQIAKSEQSGSFVISGKLLQLKMRVDSEEGKLGDGQILTEQMKAVFDMAAAVMIKGKEWYACDIVAERVYGQGLLMDFERALALQEVLQGHEDAWVRRAIGIGVHLALKKQPGAERAKRLMDLMMRQVHTRDFHVKKGCGWGVETIAKFYPEVARAYEARILGDSGVNAWVKMKYKLGMKAAEKRRLKGV